MNQSAEILARILRGAIQTEGREDIWAAPDGDSASVTITIDGKTYVLEVAEA